MKIWVYMDFVDVFRPHSNVYCEPKMRATSQSDNVVRPYTLVNGVTRISDCEINIEAITSLVALLELEELSVDLFSQSLGNGELSEMVVI